MNLYNIPANYNFLDSLASGLLIKYGSDPISLSKIMVLLPNRRSCRALRDSFLRINQGKTMLLPRIHPIGDIEDEDFSLIPAIQTDIYNLPPVISPIKQQFLLSKIIKTWKSIDGHISDIQALMLAKELYLLLTEVNKEQLSWESIEKIVPDDLAKHWQITLDFLKILTEQWPQIIESEGHIDIVTYRNKVHNMLADFWQKNPPNFPVIAAGSTGSIPATAKLLSTIAQMENGSVILPSLDCNNDEEAIKEYHPQYGLLKLLEKMQVNIASIKAWQHDIKPSSKNSRETLIKESMRLASSVHKWQDLRGQLSESSFKNISIYAANNLQEEADMIALIMRSNLESKEKTTALVTPDRELARKTANSLKKWGILIDDSAGKPLLLTPIATFFHSVADLINQKFSSISLLKTLKHPLCANGFSSNECRQITRKLEISLLRGIKKHDDIISLQKLAKKNNYKEIENFLDVLHNNLQDLIACYQSKDVPFLKILTNHIKCAELLSSTNEENGQDIFWSLDGAKELKELFDEIIECQEIIGDIDPYEYTAIIESFLRGKIYYSKWGQHPRLHILSPMEARLCHYDCVILGSINEGMWPQSSKSDPWMSRPMRSNFGLPLPEKKIGMMAHDFYQLACSKEVILTRSEKLAGTATIPSRWLLRLESIAKLLNYEKELYPVNNWQEWVVKYNQPDKVEAIKAPEPKPNASLRPKALSVTSIEKLMRNPYAIYAAKILKLKELENIDKDPEALEFGNFIHNVFELYTKDYNKQYGLENIKQIARDIIKQESISQIIVDYWWPRFERIAKWFIDNDQIRRKKFNNILAEEWGKISLDGFELSAKADRIETGNNQIAIIDYKTGTIPKTQDIENGISPQMILEALIAVENGFQVKDVEVSELLFWKLSGSDKGSSLKDAIKPAKIAENIETAKEGLINLIKEFEKQETPYLACPDPKTAPKYNQYEHLSRIKEWKSG